MPEERKFQIHNTTRDPRTRTQRARAAQHQKTTLLIGGMRVFRNRPALVTEKQVHQLLAELKRLEAVGRAKVTDVLGLKVDLGTLQTVERAAPVPPKPKKVLDSAARDKQRVGQDTVQYPGGATRGEAVAPPLVGKAAVPEGKEPVGSQDTEPPPPPVLEEAEEEEEGEEPEDSTSDKPRRRRRKKST